MWDMWGLLGTPSVEVGVVYKFEELATVKKSSILALCVARV